MSTNNTKSDDGVTKSWFCVFDNPELHGYDGTPQEIVDRLLGEWMDGNPQRSCAGTYCISATGLKHVHLVLEDMKSMRFSSVKKQFPSIHFEPTKGSKEKAVNYIKKRGEFAEEGEQVVYFSQIGEIQGNRGTRRDLDVLEELINNGSTPAEIMRMSLSYRRYEKFIRDAYFDKRSRETPFIRDVHVTWHVGESGSGKTYCAKKIVEEKGEDALYFVSDYSAGGMDMYNGQPVLFLDEFRGQVPFHTLLSWLDCYKTQVHARYVNSMALWNEVHISSVLPPEKVYSVMVSENRDVDTMTQLFRRINCIVYHYKDASSNYNEYSMSIQHYKCYEQLKVAARFDDFVVVDDQEKLLFD